MKADLLIESLDQRWDKYSAELRNSRKDFSEAAIHELRVATRRMLAALELVRAVVQHARIRKLTRIFKLQLDGLDQLRDTQVMLADIPGNIGGMPGLEPFQTYLHKREKRLLRAARKQVKALKPGPLHQKLVTVRKMIGKINARPGSPARLLRVVDDAYREVLQRRERVDLADAASIHRLRIAFKKFRHMVEIVFPLLPAFPVGNLKRMQALQTVMGEIQDCEVGLAALAKFAAAAQSFEAAPAILFYEQRRALALTNLPGSLGDIDGLWRTSPDAPFTWRRRPAIKPVRARRPRSSL